jgi:hypothetical protein
MATANDLFQDRLIRRAVDLLAFDSDLSARVIEALNTSERAVVAKIRESFDELLELAGADRAPGMAATDAELRQLNAILAEISEVRRLSLAGSSLLVRETLTQLVIDEVAFTQAAFAESVAIEGVTLDPPTRARVRAITFGTPFGQGPGSPVRTSSQWFASLERRDIQRIQGAIQAGFIEGDTIGGIVRRVRGSRALGGVDGVTEITRRQVRRLVRTTVNHFSNTVREEMFAVNPDFMMALVWTSVLDGRTSSICQSRDGKFTNAPGQEFPPQFQNKKRLQPPDARPPAHPNCRSVMVAALDPDGIVGKRPFVMDTRTRPQREVDFRKTARREDKSIQQVRAEWARDRVGTVPAQTNYQDWLSRQSAKFQDEVLGPTRGKLFRGGGLTVDKFVDNTGRRLTLDDLREVNAGAFEQAGV